MARFAFRAAIRAACVALACLAAPSPRALPAERPEKEEETTLEEAIRRLQDEVESMKSGWEARITSLEERLAAGKAAAESVDTAGGESQAATLDDIDELLDRLDAMDAEIQRLGSKGGGETAYIDVAFNMLFGAGASTAPEDLLPELEGGHHDPHKRGFTLQNAELYLSGAVDPYFRGDANIVYTINKEGETVVELEEAYLRTVSLPYGLQLKAGQYFTSFGRINVQHPHQWDFVDQPVINTRFFGDDGLRGPGAQLSWLTPVSFPLEMTVGMQNADGPTAFSFLGSGDEIPFGENQSRAVHAPADLLTTARITASADVTDELPVQLGASGAWGPSAAAEGRSTSIAGVDFVAKWRPETASAGFPFVSFQTEWMWRHYPYDAFFDPDTAADLAAGSLSDSGGYAQVTWGFLRDWAVGTRYELANGDFPNRFGLDDRARYAVALTYYPTHFSKVRVQVNRDRVQSLDKSYTYAWLQLEINIGAHGAHNF